MHMCVSVCECVWVWACVRDFVCVTVCVHGWVWQHTSESLYVWPCECVHVHEDMWKWVCMCVSTWECICVCVHVYCACEHVSICVSIWGMCVGVCQSVCCVSMCECACAHGGWEVSVSAMTSCRFPPHPDSPTACPAVPVTTETPSLGDCKEFWSLMWLNKFSLICNCHSKSQEHFIRFSRNFWLLLVPSSSEL